MNRPLLISKAEAARLVGLHPESVMRLSRHGGFPAPIRVQDARNSRVRFELSEIETWIASRRAAAQ